MSSLPSEIFNRYPLSSPCLSSSTNCWMRPRRSRRSRPPILPFHQVCVGDARADWPSGCNCPETYGSCRGSTAIQPSQGNSSRVIKCWPTGRDYKQPWRIFGPMNYCLQQQGKCADTQVYHIRFLKKCGEPAPVVSEFVALPTDPMEHTLTPTLIACHCSCVSYCDCVNLFDYVSSLFCVKSLISCDCVSQA